MKGYLLDTNAISDWLDRTSSRHIAVSRKVQQLAGTEALLLTSTIVLGEIDYGIQAAPQRRQLLDELRAHVEAQFVHRHLLLAVARSTATVYGDLRARLFEKFAPLANRKKAMRSEELRCPVTSKLLGIQENDLWIAAQAIERNLVLVSNDGMTRIREIAPELVVEDWAAAAGGTRT